jgi:hypothetical protein
MIESGLTNTVLYVVGDTPLRCSLLTTPREKDIPRSTGCAVIDVLKRRISQVLRYAVDFILSNKQHLITEQRLVEYTRTTGQNLTWTTICANVRYDEQFSAALLSVRVKQPLTAPLRVKGEKEPSVRNHNRTR